MNDRYVLLLIALFTFVILFITGFFLQDMSRKGIFFGVRLPENYYTQEPFKGIKRKYRVDFAIMFAVYTFLSGILIYFSQNPGLFILILLLGIVVINGNYYHVYFKVRKLKNSDNYQIPKRDIVVVDTDFRTSKTKHAQVSRLWFLLPAAISLFSAAASIIYYDKAPQMIAHHWGITGAADAWSPKSYFTVLSLPVFMIVFTAIMYISYCMIERPRPVIDPDDVEKSREQNRIFRYIWSAFYAVLSIVLAVISMVLHLSSLEVINISPTVSIIIEIPLFIIAVLSIVLSIAMGQGGSRIKIPKAIEHASSIIDRDDDKYWILGDFYYNPDDPSLFVEKRMGVGWDFNYGRPLGKLMAALLVMLFIGIFIMSVILIVH